MHHVGDILQGRYRIEALLGQGGMGGVYLATHQGLNVRVAVKEMTIDVREAGMVAQFRREAQMLHQLHHPNLPRVSDFFESEGRHYLVMDYIEGLTLDDLVRVDPAAEADVLRWTQELCSVLDYLHHLTPPIIFRDLKPGNIMLADTGQIKLIDFGIAKDFDVETGLGTRTTVRGAGTPGFAAPEQYGSGTDARTDIYSLGATLYCLLTRVTPPDATDRAGGVREMAPLSSLRPDLRPTTSHAIERMMALNRVERPASIQEVAQLFGLSLRGSAGTVVPVASTEATVPAAPLGGETILSPRARALETNRPQARASAASTATVSQPPTVPSVPPRAPLRARPSRSGVVGLALAAAAILGGLGGLAWRSTHLVLVVNSDPPGALVSVDGAAPPFPTTPARITGLWRNSNVLLHLHKDGFMDRPVEVAATLGSTLVHLAPEIQYVTVTTDRGQGHLLVDGTDQGLVDTNRRSFRISEGSHRLSVLPDTGYQAGPPVTITVSNGGAPALARLRLNALPATVTFDVPATVRVRINGESAAGPLARFTDLAPGWAVIEAAGPGFFRLNTRIPVAPGSVKDIPLMLRRQGGWPPAPPIRGDIILPAVGIGELQLGHPAAPVIQRFHLEPGAPFEDRNSGLSYPTYHRPGLAITLQGDRLRSVRVDGRNSRSKHTREGLKFGDTLVRVQQVMGHELRAVTLPGWVNYAYPGVVFNIRDNRVIGITVIEVPQPK